MESKNEFDFDLIVIGGGSGGLSCSKQAASLGAKVALFDFVKPSTQGTTWGLGGTCVNVGCVPKKLMHYASLIGESSHDGHELGWHINEAKHDWNKLVETVTNHVHMLNFRYRNGLRSKNVHYIRALADLVDHHTISYEEVGKVKTITSEHIVISVGGRPHVPSDIPGTLDYAITSDDIFTLDHPPGKTLCVGGSYISLECAGFLTGLGYDVSVAVRSILLRGFDRQCAEKIGTFMEESGTTFLYDTVVRSIDKTHKGRLQVTLYHPNEDKETIELYDTVLFATGRTPDLKGLKLSKLGVKVNEKTGKIIVNNEVTSIPNIYAIGDVCDGAPELTPVAIKAGELLAKRLFSRNQKDRSKFMDYQMIPTTVYTPTEYGSIGFSEEDAKEKFGEENIEVYLSEFTTLEISAVHRLRRKRKFPTEINQEIQQEEEENNTNDGVERNDEENEEDVMSPNCLAKLICLKTENERVIGFHFVGPNAGEITQGFALAVRLGATKEDFDDLVSIHPTDAEAFCSLSVTKSSGLSWVAAGGCGGGVCG